ncbi:MAG: efflux RND transporter periplasmic adaptor subunit [Bdellovibrio bacteriovorus]
MSPSRRRLSPWSLLAAIAAALMGVLAWTPMPSAEEGGSPAVAPAGRPALTVVLAVPEPAEWPQTIAAYGNIAPWQEAVIGSELSGYRLTEVLVNVGDQVTQGQLLARLASDTVGAELAQSRAAVEEAQARLAEARADADRARRIEERGALSDQQVNQLLTGEQAALARVHAAEAKVQADELRLSQTRILAPDDGVISARTATVGSLAQNGQELFRLIRGGRLEWRAEVTAVELARVRPGMAATLVPPGTGPESLVQGQVRVVAPTLDPQTRNALVYVDLPADSPLRAGMFVRGEIRVGAGRALTLPQGAVVLREGFAYVYRVGPDHRVSEVKVELGRRLGERVEITRGVTPEMRLVASGAGFLTDGDLVRVVEAPTAGRTASQ